MLSVEAAPRMICQDRLESLSKEHFLPRPRRSSVSTQTSNNPGNITYTAVSCAGTPGPPDSFQTRLRSGSRIHSRGAEHRGPRDTRWGRLQLESWPKTMSLRVLSFICMEHEYSWRIQGEAIAPAPLSPKLAGVTNTFVTEDNPV